MRTVRLSIVICILFDCIALSRAEEPKISFEMPIPTVSQVLQLYEHESGKELIIASNAEPHLNQAVSLGSGALPRQEFLKLARERLAEQAHIIVTEVGDQVSITYNDNAKLKTVLPNWQPPALDTNISKSVVFTYDPKHLPSGTNETRRVIILKKE